MGTTLYWMNVSLDLFIEATPGEDGGGDWLRIGEQLHREINRRASDLSSMVQGRVIYEIMENAWPAMATDPTMPDYMQEYGRIWIETPKFLVSRTRTDADFNTEVIGGDDVIGRIGDLRSSTEGVIGVGGATLATELLEAGMLDELLLFIHPVILGRGRPLFDRLTAQVEFDLAEAEEFDGGVTMHRYVLLP